MASFDYAKVQGTADKLIAQFGRLAELHRDVNGTTSSRSCTVVEIAYDAREMDGQIIGFADTRFLVSALDLDPAPDPEEDKLVLDDVNYRIVTSRPLKPADVVVYYELQVRR